MSSTYIAGYRIGMVTSGAGALYLASLFGSYPGNYSYRAWSLTYMIMASTMLVGVVTTLVMREPEMERTVAYQYAGSRLRAAGGASSSVRRRPLPAVSLSAAGPSRAASEAIGGGALTAFLLETVHFALAIACAVAVGWPLVAAGPREQGDGAGDLGGAGAGFLSPLRTHHRAVAAGADRAVPDLGHRARRHRQCLLSGPGLFQAADREGGEHLRRHRQHRSAVSLAGCWRPASASCVS